MPLRSSSRPEGFRRPAPGAANRTHRTHRAGRSAEERGSVFVKHAVLDNSFRTGRGRPEFRETAPKQNEPTINLIPNHMLKLFQTQSCDRLARFFAVLLLAIFCWMPATAQQRVTVTGTVTDGQKQPVAGASVVQTGTMQGTTTDSDGKFTLKVTGPEVSLDVAFIGMKPQTVPVAGKTHLDIVLEEESVNVEEVVVTALGIKRETKALGYAVASVDKDDLTAGREANIMQAMVGKVAGVDISTTTAGPTGSSRVLIRGNSQLSGSNLPLYVIDGMPVDNSQLQGADGKWGGSGFDFGDVMSSINPEDIENVTILKGPSASALYGSMASNGVVMITTKSGSARKESLGIEVSSNISFTTLLSKFNDYQRVYGMGRNGSIPLTESDGRGTTQVAWGGKLDPNVMIQIYNGEWKPYGNVNNNVLSFFDTGFTAQNSVSLSNATEKTSFRFAVTDMRNKDIVPKSEFNRTNFTMRGSTRLGKTITVDASASYVIEEVKNRPALTDNASNIGNSLVGIAPNFDQRWLSKTYKDENGNYYQWNGSDYRFNPYWVINEMRNESSRNRLMGNAKITWEIVPWLKIAARGGLDTYDFRATTFDPVSTPRQTEGRINERVMNVLQSNLEATLTFTKKYGDFDINAFVGASLWRNKNEQFTSEGLKQVLPGVKDLNAFERISTTHGLYKKEVRSMFGSVSLGYKGWAYLDATIRNDVSSALSPENRSYWYPSVSGSVIFSSLFKHGDWLSFGKLRASWANVGGDTDPYQLYLDFGLKTFDLNGQSLGEVSNTVIPYYNLKPTSSNSMEVGLDLKFFQSRLGIDLTLYQQTTKDQIMSLPISSGSGFTKALINAGKIRNRGIELAVSGTPLKTKSVSWEMTFTYATNDNKVLELHPDVPSYELTAARWANAYIYAMEGEEYGVIVGQAQKRTPDGKVIVDEKTGLPTFEADVSVLGKGTYNHTFGWAHNFRWKNLNLRMLFDAKFGADMYSMSMMQSYYNGTSKKTLKGRDAWYRSEQAKVAAGSPADWVATGGYLVDGVKPAGTDADGNTVYVKNDIYVNPQAYWQSFQDVSPEPFIIDASYIKFRELALSFSFPKSWLRKTPLAGVELTAFARNLCILYSNVDNIDPESSYYNGNGQGFEYGSLPSRRTFGFGIKVKF